jgi:hypothetical protein
MLPETGYETYDDSGKKIFYAGYFEIEGSTHEEFISTFFLRCNRTTCKEIVATVGKQMRKNVQEDFDICYEIEVFKPEFFYPQIDLFTLPTDLPVSIHIEIQKAFSLFWSDPSACSNAIRKTAERILDHIETTPSANKNLAPRIKLLETNDPNLKIFLDAIRNVGNEGSHRTSLEHYDVIVTFKFIENILNSLFGNDNICLVDIAKKINDTKLPVSKH